MKKIFLTLTTLLSASALFSQGPGCPSIDVISYQGTNVSPITLPCDSTCVTLTADVFQIAQTTSYTVSSLPWSGFPYSASTGVSLNTDDRWSGVINLPFRFCFFGNVFNQVVVSSNGAVSFNTQYANSFHQWAFGAGELIPTNTAAFRPNTIFGAMHDTDPSKGGTIRYGVQGNFPCRVFVMSFDNLRHYDCSSKRTTQQIVIYEGTNIVEVYIQNKPNGCSWNGGRAAIGIQNAAGDVGYTPPGRNTGNWSAANEAWRFSPSGAPSYQITWHETNVNNPPVGTGPTFVACPTNSFSTYSALLTYTNCANETTQFWQSIDINLSAPGLPAFTSNSPVCETQTLTFDGPTVAGATYFWTGPGGWTANTENPTRPGATSAMTGNYNLYVVVAGCTSAVATQQVTVVGATTTPVFTTNSPVCEGDTIELNSQLYNGATYVWNGPNGFTGSGQSPNLVATAAAGGNYNLYIVVGGCTSATATVPVSVSPTPAAPTFSTNSPICVGEDINLNGPNIPGASYNWSGPSGWFASTEDPTRPNANLGAAGDYILSVTVAGCTSPESTQTVVINGPDVPVFSTTSPVCTGESIVFTANVIPGATYVWSGPNGWDPGNVATATILNSNASMTGNYSLYLVSNGCTSEATVVPVFVTPQLAPSFTVNAPLCVGDTIQLDAPADSTIFYHWSGPNSWLDSSGSSPFIVGATTAMSGTYSLYTVTLGCTSSVGSQAVTVNPIPAAPTVSSNSPVCEGSSLNLNGPTVAGATYAWSGPNSFSSGTEDPILNPSTTNMAGTYQLTVEVAGCVSPASSINAIINDTAQVVPNITPITPCEGSLVNFGATVNLTPPSVILGSGWDVDGNGIPDYATTQATHVYTTPGTYNTTYAVVTTGNCTTAVSVPVTVSPKPTVTYTGPSQVCGTSLALTSTGQVQPPATINNYTWYLTGGSSIGIGQNLAHTFNVNPFQQVTGYVVSSTANGCSDTATFSIDLQPSPISSFTYDECIGLSIPFDNTTTWQGTPAPGTTVASSWSFGDGQTSVLEEPSHIYPSSGTYQVTLISTSSAFNCSDTIALDVPVSIIPDGVITATPECFQNVTFLGQVNSFGSDIQSILWDLGNGGSSTDTSFIYEYAQAGTYNVTLTITNEENCSTTVVTPVTVLPSPTLSEIEIPNVLTPNGDGTNDELKLDAQFESCTDYEMMIFNRWGNVIYRQVKGGVPFKGLSNAGKKLTNGVYFYTIKSGNLDKNGTITIAN